MSSNKKNKLMFASKYMHMDGGGGGGPGGHPEKSPSRLGPLGGGGGGGRDNGTIRKMRI